MISRNNTNFKMVYFAFKIPGAQRSPDDRFSDPMDPQDLLDSLEFRLESQFESLIIIRYNFSIILIQVANN